MISIVSSAVRLLLWLDFYRHLGTNKDDYNILTESQGPKGRWV